MTKLASQNFETIDLTDLASASGGSELRAMGSLAKDLFKVGKQYGAPGVAAGLKLVGQALRGGAKLY